MPRLSKAQVEQLVNGYDRDPVDALRTALVGLGAKPGASWSETVGHFNFPGPLSARLAAGDQDALDGLLKDLIELRDISR